MGFSSGYNGGIGSGQNGWGVYTPNGGQGTVVSGDPTLPAWVNNVWAQQPNPALRNYGVYTAGGSSYVPSSGQNNHALALIATPITRDQQGQTQFTNYFYDDLAQTGIQVPYDFNKDNTSALSYYDPNGKPTAFQQYIMRNPSFAWDYLGNPLPGRSALQGEPYHRYPFGSGSWPDAFQLSANPNYWSDLNAEQLNYLGDAIGGYFAPWATNNKGTSSSLSSLDTNGLLDKNLLEGLIPLRRFSEASFSQATNDLLNNLVGDTNNKLGAAFQQASDSSMSSLAQQLAQLKQNRVDQFAARKNNIQQADMGRAPAGSFDSRYLQRLM